MKECQHVIMDQACLDNYTFYEMNDLQIVDSHTFNLEHYLHGESAFLGLYVYVLHFRLDYEQENLATDRLQTQFTTALGERTESRFLTKSLFVDLT